MGTVVGILERERREYVASFEVSITHQVTLLENEVAFITP